jgi:hypothetical protein
VEAGAAGPRPVLSLRLSLGMPVQKLTIGAINSRVSRAVRIERELGVSLDEATESKENLRDLKRQLRDSYTRNVAAALYNTATRYYKFRHGEDPEQRYREFLKL